MFISDMHLAANYGLVAQYADNYGVDLIINTGDESEFGTAAELTPAYLDQLRALTARTRCSGWAATTTRRRWPGS